MIRLLMSSTAAVVLLAAPMAASAATTAAKHAAAKPMHHITKASSKSGKHSAKPMARDGGAAAVDSLNDQALQRAKNGDAPQPQ